LIAGCTIFNLRSPESVFNESFQFIEIMVLCASCKNKTSLLQCTSHALKGLLFCGKHIKCKDKRIWALLTGNNSKALLIQKIWRGYFIRTKLKLAGPGALNRKDCHNSEELVTLDDKLKVHPLDYFSFMEADKLYWFDIRSLHEYVRNSPNPTNPYTRQPITLDARKNLRKLCQIRKREGRFNLHSEPMYQEFAERVNRKWLEMCQIIEENGFESVNHLLFASLNKTQLYVLLNFMYIDLIEFASEHKTPNSTRKKYCFWMKSLISKFVKFKYGSLQASFNVVRCLLSILNDCPQPYTVCFIIISAVVRL